jgi:hypothetical protein
MSAIDKILKKTIFELSENISNTGFLNHIICEMTNFIENEKFYSTQQFQAEDLSNIPPQNIEENSANSSQVMVEEPQIKVDVSKAPTFSEILKKDLPISPISSQSVVSSNSVTSTNSSRNSGQQYFIEGISYENPKNQKVDDINEFMNSMLEQGIVMWRIIYYIYISNKEFDNSASTSVEDAENNIIAPKILAAYSSNQLLNFNEIHEFFPYMKYYFEKIIKYENGKYVKNITGNIFLKTRFLSQITSRIKK